MKKMPEEGVGGGLSVVASTLDCLLFQVPTPGFSDSCLSCDSGPHS